ncbi:hypothetical protein ACOME3_003134 [Neoechinorhynchus agilis]
MTRLRKMHSTLLFDIALLAVFIASGKGSTEHLPARPIAGDKDVQDHVVHFAKLLLGMLNCDSCRLGIGPGEKVLHCKRVMLDDTDHEVIITFKNTSLMDFGLDKSGKVLKLDLELGNLRRNKLRSMERPKRHTRRLVHEEKPVVIDVSNEVDLQDVHVKMGEIFKET